MARDFVHTAEVLQAVLDVLEGADGTTHTNGLPANWFPDTQDEDEVPLEVLEPGDYVDHAIDDLKAICPAIFVRGLGIGPSQTAGTGGAANTVERVRLLHVRRFDQCRKANGEAEKNMTLARARYAKVIGKALFADPNLRLGITDAEGARTGVTLTCVDPPGAQIQTEQFLGWDLGTDGESATEDVRELRQMCRGRELWAIACDIGVQILTGGNR